MSRFNTAPTKVRGKSFITTPNPIEATSWSSQYTTTINRYQEPVPAPVTTYQGGKGFERDTKSELFLLAVSQMGGQDNYYETAGKSDTRFAELVRKATVEDAEWTAEFLVWLRSEANMRTNAIVGVAEYTRTMLELNLPGSRQTIAQVIQRADEPGELLAYWTGKYGRRIPMPLKRGIADAILRLGNEFAYLKYDGESKGYRFADLLNLTHPGDKKGSRQEFKGQWQKDLFAYATTAPYRKVELPATLGTLTRRQALMELPVNERRAALEPVRLREAGMTWEALAGWLQGPMDREAWEAIIPSMGYMALLRNLRNFDQAGVSNDVAAKVAAKLADPDEVKRSRQLPMRFLSAYKAAPSLRWAWPLEQALNYSLENIPRLHGQTLILVDTSGSMGATFSKDGTLNRMDAAALFGIALASRCDRANLVSYSSASWGNNQGTLLFPPRPGESVLAAHKRWATDGFFIGGGTDTWGAAQKHFNGQDRVVILTDEQTGPGYYGGYGGYNAWGQPRQAPADDTVIPADTPLYTWNLAGYKYGHNAAGQDNRHTFGGLTDQSFKMIPLLEAGRDANWPWVGVTTA